jgi:hypothetical protein
MSHQGIAKTKIRQANSQRSAKLQKIIGGAQTLGPQVIRTLEVNEETPATTASPTPLSSWGTNRDTYIPITHQNNGVPLPVHRRAEVLKPVAHTPPYHHLCDIHIWSHPAHNDPVFTVSMLNNRGSADIGGSNDQSQPTTDPYLLRQYAWHHSPVIQSLYLDSLQQSLLLWQKRKISQASMRHSGPSFHETNTQPSA